MNDPNVVQGMVSFKSGTATVQGYQARPKAAGMYPAVVVMHGDFGIPDINRYTAAVLAQNGFASLAIKRFSRYPELTIQDINKSDRTDRRYLSKAFNQEELQDAHTSDASDAGTLEGAIQVECSFLSAKVIEANHAAKPREGTI